MSELLDYITAICLVLLAWAMIRLNDKVRRIQQRLESHLRRSGRKSAGSLTDTIPTNTGT